VAPLIDVYAVVSTPVPPKFIDDTLMAVEKAGTLDAHVSTPVIDPVAATEIVVADDVVHNTPPAPNDVTPVPPFAIGRVPLTCVVKPTFPQLGDVVTPPEIITFPVATAVNAVSVVAADAYKMSPTA
jgi:hypothetical protein